MTDDFERPRFWQLFFEALAERSRNRSLISAFVFPLLAGALAAFACYFMPSSYWSDANLQVSVAVYAGMLTFNGLMLALGWNAFSRIYDMLSAPRFSQFLRKNKLLEKYLVTISLIQGLQIFAIIASATALLSILFNLAYLWVDRAILGLMLFASMLALKQGAKSVRIMHDLVWQKSIYDERIDQRSQANVVDLERQNDVPR